MRKLSSLLILSAVVVWSYQFSLWVVTGGWEVVALRTVLVWLGWVPETGSITAALCDLNLGLLTLAFGLSLFYINYPTRRLLEERRNSLERLALQFPARAEYTGRPHNRPCSHGGSHFWHVP